MVALTVCFLISLVFSVNCSYLNPWFLPFVPPALLFRCSGWEGGREKRQRGEAKEWQCGFGVSKERSILRKPLQSPSPIMPINNIPVYSEQHPWREMISAYMCSLCPLPCQSSLHILHTFSEKEQVSAGYLLAVGSCSYDKETGKYWNLWKSMVSSERKHSCKISTVVSHMHKHLHICAIKTG